MSELHESTGHSLSSLGIPARVEAHGKPIATELIPCLPDGTMGMYDPCRAVITLVAVPSTHVMRTNWIHEWLHAYCPDLEELKGDQIVSRAAEAVYHLISQSAMQSFFALQTPAVPLQSRFVETSGTLNPPYGIPKGTTLIALTGSSHGGVWSWFAPSRMIDMVEQPVLGYFIPVDSVKEQEQA